MRMSAARSAAALAAATLVFAACGSDGVEQSDAESDGAPGADESDASQAPEQADTDEVAVEVPTIVVTTNILGDVVEEVVGDAAEVVTLMPVGADPHDFQASAQEVNTLMSADALIVNGAAFEEGLLDVIEGAEDEGIPTFEAMSVVDTIEFGEGGHDHSDEEHSDEEDHDHSDEEHSDEEDHDHSSEENDEDHDHSDEEHSDEEGHDHSDEEHSDEEDHDHSDEEKDEDDDHSDEEHADEEHSDEEHADHDHEGHDHSGDDPHFFTDPMRMAAAVEGIVDFLQAELDAVDAAALDASADAYIAQLTALDAEVAELVEAIATEQRVLVTNHEVFGYFADRYGFEIVGAVVPGGSTTDSVSAGELAELAEIIKAEGVPAIFADTSSSDELVQTLADEVGDVAVVALYSESLGDADSDGATYLEMVRSNAERISAALA